MTYVISVRGRKEPISLDDERGKAIKILRFGTIDNMGRRLKEPADPKDDIDLGSWVGEIGMIRSIEHEKTFNREDARAKMRREDDAYWTQWFTLSSKEKSKHLGRFKFFYAGRVRFDKTNHPTKKLLAQAQKVQLEYYEKNAMAREVPVHLLDPLLPKRQKHFSLSEKLSVDNSVAQIPA